LSKGEIAARNAFSEPHIYRLKKLLQRPTRPSTLTEISPGDLQKNSKGIPLPEKALRGNIKPIISKSA
jgi:hypothetical protein